MQKRKLSKNEQGIIGIGYDENSPITEDDFIGNISKIDDSMDVWYHVAVEKGKDIKEATRRLTK